MKCQFCPNPATVHLTDIINQKKREMHLCDACAREPDLVALMAAADRALYQAKTLGRNRIEIAKPEQVARAA